MTIGAIGKIVLLDVSLDCARFGHVCNCEDYDQWCHVIQVLITIGCLFFVIYYICWDDFVQCKICDTIVRELPHDAIWSMCSCLKANS